MRLAKLMVVAVATTVALTAGCSRNNIEAVNLANEGDKARESNPDDAISKYEQAKQLDPSNYRIQWKLARTYQKKESWDKVNETLGPATKLAPDHADFFWLKGYALEQMANKGPTAWTEAKEPLEQAIKLDPNYADPHFDLAEVLLHLDDEKGALEHYTKAIELKPDQLGYYGPLADLYIRLGFLDQAEQVLKEGVSWDKGDKSGFSVHSLYGLVLERKGDASGAVREFEAAKKSCGACNEKGEQIAFYNLGAAYAKANPPRKSEANSNLLAFQKTVCRGGAAQRYADECTQAQELLKIVGGQAP
jgi:tetratricopeptide (TPR) repeat protein